MSVAALCCVASEILVPQTEIKCPLHWEHGILTTEDSREVPGLTFMMETNLIFKILPVSMIKICGYLEQVKNNNLGKCLISKTSNNSGIISEYISFEKK